jgi:glycosyltransferase involved in cell wall biosynthesis
MERKIPKPRILYVWPYLEWGGAQIYFTGIIKHIRGSYDVVAAMPEGTDAKLIGYLHRLDIKTEFFPAHLDSAPAATIGKKIRRRFVDARCAFIIARYLSQADLGNTLIHADLGPWSFFFLLAYLSLRTHVAVTLHIAIPKLSLFRQIEWQIKFRILSRLRRFHLLASNRDMHNSLKPYLSAKLLQRIPVAYTGIDEGEINQALTSTWNRQTICERYQLPSDSFLVFSLGQLVQRKGYLVLLEAVGVLRKRYSDLFFVWIGEGSLRQEIECRIKSAGLQDCIRLIAPKDIGPDRLDLLHLLRAADLFVHPSFSEGLPGALLEAMALEKASIATSVNAIPEVIRDGTTGVLVPPGNANALAEAIAVLAADPDRRRALAVAGRAAVVSNFTEEKAAGVTAACYDTCFSSK